MARNKTFCMHGTVLSDFEKEILSKKHDEIFLATIFSRNIVDYNQLLQDAKSNNLNNEQVECSKNALSELIENIKSYDSEIKIAIDNEGGTVYRFPWSKLQYENASYFGELYKDNPSAAIEKCRQQYEGIAYELKDIGIDINFAPVMDLAYISEDQSKNFIYDRAFSTDPDAVSTLTQTAIDAMLSNDITPVVKHIPGHGYTRIDTHSNHATINATIDYLNKNDFIPFKYIASCYPNNQVYGMISHIEYTALDKDNIAPLSKKVINFIRDKEEGIGFNNLLITDAIEMNACKNFVMEKYTEIHSSNVFSTIVNEIEKTDPNIVILFCGYNKVNNQDSFNARLYDYFGL